MSVSWLMSIGGLTTFTCAAYISHDPWRVLVATMLLNVTTGRAAMPVFWELMRRWPTADAMSRGTRSVLKQLFPPTDFVS